MKILALEFSSLQRSVALIQTTTPKNQIASRAGVSEIIQTGGVGTNLLGMVDAALQKMGVEREQVEVLAIGLGPGSYSGIRRAIAVAQGWELARFGTPLKLLGVSSTDCLVTQAQEQSLRGRFTVVIDAQRGEFYIATYDINSEGYTNIEPLRIATLQELQQREAAGECFIGPEAARFRNGCVTFPRASTLARLANNRNDFVSGEKLEPIYLRKTQFVRAQPARTIS